MKTGIIIPCYNEGKRLNQSAFVNFISNNQDFILCFVNDGSKDNTLQVLHEIKSQCMDRVSIVDVKKNAGKAAAVRAGVRFLFSKNNISNIGFMDADLSTDFKDFKDLVTTLQREDKLMVFGSRNMGKKETIKRDFFRKIFSNIVKRMTTLILGLPIRDTQCGAKVFKKSVVPIAYRNEFKSKWLFDIEIFLRLKKHLGSSDVMSQICEQPLMRWVHVEDSKLGFKDALQIPFMLLQIWTTYTLAKNEVSPMLPEIGFSISENTSELSIAA